MKHSFQLENQGYIFWLKKRSICFTNSSDLYWKICEEKVEIILMKLNYFIIEFIDWFFLVEFWKLFLNCGFGWEEIRKLRGKPPIYWIIFDCHIIKNRWKSDHQQISCEFNLIFAESATKKLLNCTIDWLKRCYKYSKFQNTKKLTIKFIITFQIRNWIFNEGEISQKERNNYKNR